MRSNLAINLERLRHEFRYTEEQVADFLGVGYLDITRWECDEAVPSPELIPVMANLFHVSADHLLGVNITAGEAEILQYLEDAAHFRRQMRYREASVLMRRALLKHPSDERILCELAENLIAYRRTAPDGRDEAVLYLHRVLDTSRNAAYLSRAACDLMHLYDEEGDTEKAVTYADMLPPIEFTREYQMEKLSFSTPEEKARSMRLRMASEERG